jgi:hypothetical protein
MKHVIPVLVLLFAVSAFGRSNAEQKKSETQKFSGLKLKGQLKKPDLSYIYKRKGLRAEQIVNIPENFNAEIIQGEGQF